METSGLPSSAGGRPSRETAAATPSVAGSSSESLIQRLNKGGVAANQLSRGPAALIEFVNEDRARLPAAVCALFPDIDEVKEMAGQDEAFRKELASLCEETVVWVQWLLFEGDPKASLAESCGGGERAICGAVWGSNDIAYRCRTCEFDPTCAICVPCFQAGDHRDHDYAMIRTGGGCCDCGDVTAWRPAGFCSHHRGLGLGPSLPPTFVTSGSPVLEAVLRLWASKLDLAWAIAEKNPKKGSPRTSEEDLASETSLAIINMLLKFCNSSESMLHFTAKCMEMKDVGILDALFRTELVLRDRVVQRLHELLYKLLGDISFKHSFAEEFIARYPKYFHDLVYEEMAASGNRSTSSRKCDHSILGKFSVQIFTVPILTRKLVIESRLLDMLLETLKELFLACIGENDRLLVIKGPTDKLFARVLDDIRYVMSHLEVARYVVQQRPEVAKRWVEIVAFIQGVYPQRRVLNSHVEHEVEDWESAYLLEIQMAAIHPLFGIGAAFRAANEIEGNTSDESSKSADDDANIVRHAKLGRITKETDGMGLGNGNDLDVEMNDVTNASRAGGKEPQLPETSRDRGVEEGLLGVLPAPLLWIFAECISGLDRWLALDAARELAECPLQPVSDSSGASSTHRRNIWRGRTRGPYRGARPPAVLLEPPGPASAPMLATAPSPATAPGRTVQAAAEGGPGRCSQLRDWLRRTRRQFPTEPSVPYRRFSGSAESSSDLVEVDMTAPSVSEVGRINEASIWDWWMVKVVHSSGTGVSRSVEENWPKMDFDVGRQEVSFHIPLHRMVALLIRKALEYESSVRRSSSCYVYPNKFVSLNQLFPEKYQMPGFSAFMMEHPLRLQVLCAQVQAGMWRRNGHTTNALCDLYRRAPWWEDSLELDLLMLQCCSAMAHPENFVDRIQSRFGLVEYFNLHLGTPNEYEPNLAKDFLVLLIRLCAEREFCGLSPMEALKRDLVQRLAIGDATHSSLLKALPRRLQESKDLDECLNSVAVYRRPTGMQQGKYVLREECWCDLDLYHPRWTLSELQAAEDRYLRARKVSAIYMQLPRWKEPFAPLQDMGRFIVSAKVHDILRSVFFHATFAENIAASRAPDGLVFAALHLLALALDVCSSLDHCIEGDGGYRHTADQEAGTLKGPDVGDPHNSVHGLWSSSSSQMGVDELPLLALSIERVHVYGVEGMVMPKSQSLLSLLVLLLERYGTIGAPSGMRSEATQYSAADLIRSLLRKFAELRRECMYEIESLAPEILHRRSVNLPMSDTANGTGKDEKTASDAQKRKAKAREQQQTVMGKMKAAQARFAASLRDERHAFDQNIGEMSRKLNEIDGMPNVESMETNCALCRDSGSSSVVCFLTLVQKSRILALARNPTPFWERPPSSEGEGLEHKQSGISGSRLDGGNDVCTAVGLRSSFHEALEESVDEDRVLELFRNRAHPGLQTARLLNPGGSPFVTTREPVEARTDEGESSGKGNGIEGFQERLRFSTSWSTDDSGMTNSKEWSSRELAFVTVLAEYVAAVSGERGSDGGREQQREEVIESGQGLGAGRARKVAGWKIRDATVNAGPELCDTEGIYLSACGHAVHQDCLDRYFSTILERYYSRSLFEGVQIVDPDMGEFLCPICRRLTNSIIPALPRTSGHHLEAKVHDDGDSSEKIGALREGSDLSDMERCSSRAIHLLQAFRLLSKSENVINSVGFRNAVNAQLPDSIKGSLDTLSVRLQGLLSPDRDHLSGTIGQITQSLHIWDVFRYTLMSVELATRTQDPSTFMPGSLSRLRILEEAVDAGKGSVLPLLHQLTQVVHGQSRQAMLLRSRGMQLLVDSVAHGVSRDLFSGESLRGDFSSLVKYLEKAQDSADVQFWKRMADPVLLHDPFSSVLWSLFSLPLPLPSEEAPFTVLVHLYYVACLIQVIACAGPLVPSEEEVGRSASSFVENVRTTLRGHVQIPSPSSRCSTPAFPALVTFRALTLPYLRQCFLLQKLISASGPILPVSRAHLWELSQRAGSTSIGRSTRNLAGDGKEDEQFRSEELEELDHLESLFSIPPLVDILNDDIFQGVAITWCHHVCSEAGALNLRPIPRPVRAVPYMLMELPTLFQDLLQRYVKERCRQCGNVPDKPALCLLCGTLCCAVSPRSCCIVNRQGECYRHAMACGAGIGVFLMLQKTNILLQRCERQALWPSPYLDAFGEEDVEQRGKPLYLSEERYSALTAMVASHGLDYSSLVLTRTSRQMLV